MTVNNSVISKEIKEIEINQRIFVPKSFFLVKGKIGDDPFLIAPFFKINVDTYPKSNFVSTNTFEILSVTFNEP
jgi:hypothetical protein